MSRTLVCYGDSNTFGMMPCACPAQNHRWPVGQRWPDLLQQHLGDAWHVIAEGLPGRTTAYDDPRGEWLNGRRTLRPVLASHAPVALLILMLGTNDLKVIFDVDAATIAANVGTLIDDVRRFAVGPALQTPQILVLSPIPINEVAIPDNASAGGDAKSRALAGHLEAICAQQQVAFLDLAPLGHVQDDGEHLDLATHARIARAVADKVQSITCTEDARAAQPLA